jgi:hypothetical protein
MATTTGVLSNDENEELPPLRVESIYNMAFIQRPQTAIVTHGDHLDQIQRDENTVIDEEEEDRRVSNSQSPLRESAASADVWVAEEDGESSTSVSTSLDESVANDQSRVEHLADHRRLATSYAQFYASPAAAKGDMLAHQRENDIQRHEAHAIDTHSHISCWPGGEHKFVAASLHRPFPKHRVRRYPGANKILSSNYINQGRGRHSYINLIDGLRIKPERHLPVRDQGEALY